MGKYNTNNLINELKRVQKSLNDNNVPIDSVIDMTPITYIPYITLEYAKQIPPVVVGMLAITKQPFYIENKETLSYLERVYKEFSKDKQAVANLRQQLENPYHIAFG